MKKKTLKNRNENVLFKLKKLSLFTALSFCLLVSNISSQAQQIINFFAASAGGYSGDGGPATCAGINNARGGKADAAGNIYLADNGNHIIRRIDAVTGIITTVAGTPLTPGYAGDGGLATAALLKTPQDIAFDPITGDMYIADGNNVIRVVLAIGGIITPASIIKTFAGFFPGTAGYAGDGLPANSPTVRLNFPRGIDVDASGTVYIAEWGNNIIRVVQGGIINTFAGSGAAGYAGDLGPALLAKMSAPVAVRHDPTSTKIFFSDYGNNVIRVVQGGIINTYAGFFPGTAGYTPDGGLANAAQFNGIWDMAVSPAGDVYISDGFNNVIRWVNHTTNIVNTFAGFFPGPLGYAGDGGLAHDPACKLGDPIGTAFDNLGNLIICDQAGQKIRIVSGPSTTYPTNYNACIGGSVTINVNPVGGTWNTSSPNITIVPSGTSCVVNGVSAGVAFVTYKIPCGYIITDTINVGPCGPVCSDTCYWKVTGNNIIGGNNTFGTLTNDDINFVSNGTFRAILQGAGNGNMGINTNTPTTFLDVNCAPPVVVPAPSGLRFENLPTGHGNVLVVDPNGYVYAANSIAFKHSNSTGDDNISGTDLQNQINQLQQQINDLKNLLTVNGINIATPNGVDVTGNSLSVSPNPSSGQANAVYSIANSFTNAAIRVTDNTGKLILEKPITGNTGNIGFTIPANIVSTQLSCSLIVDGKILATQKLVLLNK